jgi:hypothetical protein
MDERSLSIATIQHGGDEHDGEEEFDSRELPDPHEGSLDDLQVSVFFLFFFAAV